MATDQVLMSVKYKLYRSKNTGDWYLIRKPVQIRMVAHDVNGNGVPNGLYISKLISYNELHGRYFIRKRIRDKF